MNNFPVLGLRNSMRNSLQHQVKQVLIKVAIIDRNLQRDILIRTRTLNNLLEIVIRLHHSFNKLLNEKGFLFLVKQRGEEIVENDIKERTTLSIQRDVIRDELLD